MKRKILIGILALILFIQVIPVDAYSIIKEELGSGHGHLMQTGEEYYQRIFYSNYTKHFYCIFGGTFPGWGTYSVFYSYSPDGINWAQSDLTLHPISFPGALNADGVNGKIEFYMTPDGKHIYYVHEDEYTSTTLRWGKVSLNKTTSRLVNNVSSTIIMEGAYGGAHPILGVLGSIRVIDDSYSIMVDEEGYVFIGFEMFWSGNQYGYYIIKSNSPDHFNYEDFGDAWDIRLELGGGTPNEKWHGRIFPAHGEEDVVWVGSYYSNFGAWEHHVSIWYDQSADDWIPIGGIFNDDEGGTWRDEVWDVGWSSDLAVLFKQDESKGIPDRIELDAIFLNEVTMTWENRTDITWTELGDPGSIIFLPQVSVREGTNAVNFAWSIAGNDTIWERRMLPNGTLEDIRIVETVELHTISAYKFFNDPNSNGPSPICWFVDGGSIDKYPVWWVGDFILGNYSLFLEAGGEEEDWEPIYSHESSTLYGPNGKELSDNWLFEGEVYELVSVVNNLTSFQVQGYDTIHNFTFNWNNETGQTWIDVSPADQFTIGLPWSNFTRDGEQTTIRWRFILDRSIVDCVNQTWIFFMENSFYGPGMWGDPDINAHIYNLGGLTYYTFTGDGGRVTGGQPFELYATNGTAGSTARAEQYYRKLQSVHFLLEIDMDSAWDEMADEFVILPGVGWIDIGIDYRQNGTWVDGFYVRLYVQDANVGHHAGGNDHDWVEWSIDWYNYNPGTEDIQNIRSNLIYSNFWGYENENLSPDYYNRTSSQLWVDLWFDRTNASTTIGGQVNSMYHGMREHGSAWWFGYGTFQPMISDYGNAMFLDDLYDYEGNVSGSMNYDLMRFYIEVGKVSDPDQGDDDTWTIRAIENLNRKQADDRMQGVEMPAFEPTLVLDMPMFQSNNPLIRAIDGLSRSIWIGALGFIKILWGAMDSIFEWAGFGPGFFSILTTYITDTIPGLVIVIMNNLGYLAISLVDIIESVFGVLLKILPAYVGSFGLLATALIQYWNFFMDILGGGMGIDFSIIEDIAIGEWISFGLWMLPFYEIWNIIWAKDVTGTLKERLGFYQMVGGGMLNFIKGMINLMGNLVQAIRSFLPI